MLTRNLYFILMFSLASLLQACGSSDTVRSDEVTQNTIFQYYTASYNEEDATITVKAQFRVGGSTGTTVELIQPSLVQHGQFELSKTTSALLGTLYTHSESSSFVTSHEWTYTNGDGDTFVNSADIESIDFSNLPVSISQASNVSIEWQGPAISTGESIRIELRDTRDFLILESTSEEGATSITVPATSLALLQQGIIRLRFVRMKLQDASQITETGGRILTEFAAQLRSANLDP